MLALLAGSVVSVVIAAPTGPEDTCPNARQVTEALQAHLSGVMVTPERGATIPRAGVLKTTLDIPPDGTVVRLSLVDGRGDVQLRRALPAPGRGRPVADCVALAETIATIVERYLSSVSFQTRETEVPVAEQGPGSALGDVPIASEDKTRAGRLFGGAAWRASASPGPSLFEVHLGGEIDLTRGNTRLTLVLHAGAEQAEKGQRRDPPMDSASLRRFSGRLGLALGIRLGPGVLEPALAAGIDLFLAETTNAPPSPSGSELKTTPAVDLGLGYRIALNRYVFVRPRAGLGLAIVRYNVAVGGSNEVIFQTPGLSFALSLDIGLVFR